MTHHWVTGVLLLVAGFMQSDADLTISTSTPTPCYGDVVTLVCHHPEVASNSQTKKYFTTTPSWRENGVGITPSTGIYLQPDTSEDFMNTTLNITITVDHFKNKSFNYSCLLVLAENGQPSGSEASGEVTVDPVEPQPPSDIHNITSHNTSIAFNWTHTPLECYEDRTKYNVSWVNIDNNTENGFNVTGEHMYNITGLVVNNTYIISVKTVVNGNVQSTAVTKNVITGEPRCLPKNQTQPVCRNSNFTLVCEVPMMYVGNYRNIFWLFGSHNTSGFTPYNTTNNGEELVIHNVTTNSIGDYGCCIELNNTDGTLVAGETYYMIPLDSPKKPHKLTLTPNDASISVSWEHNRSCFEDHEFEFIVTWQKVNAGDNSENMTVHETAFNIQDLEPRANYNICISAVSTTDKQVKSGETCQIASTPSTGGVSSIPIVVPIAVVIIAILIGAVVVILIVCVVWRYKKCKKEHFKTLGQPESGSTAAIGRRVTDQGDLQAIRDQPQTTSQRATTVYAELDLSGDRPVPPPPSLEKVTYTEVGTKPSKDVDTSPELPPKQDQQQIKAFRDDVKAVLDKKGVICKDLEDTEELKGIRRELAFTAEDDGIHFIVICVYTSSDVTLEDVSRVVKAKQVTGSTKGLLISNQSTIPSECLLTLEDAGCDFVPVSGYGEKGWEDRMVDKFKDVFLKEANDDSKKEHPTGPVQKTSLPPDGDQSGSITVSNDDSELRSPVQESSPPPDDNGELPITHPKEKVVGMVLAEHDKKPSLDHATPEESTNVRSEEPVEDRSSPSPDTSPGSSQED